MSDLRPGSGDDAANDPAHQDLSPDARQAALKAAHQAEIAAALLGLSRPVDCFSRLLTIAALVLLVLQVNTSGLWIPLTMSIAFGILECGFALRCAFDAPLFASWARRWQQGIAHQDDLAAFDLAIKESGLGRQPEPTRGIAERTAGARRLLRNQCRCLALQVGAWIGGFVFMFIS